MTNGNRSGGSKRPQVTSRSRMKLCLCQKCRLKNPAGVVIPSSTWWDHDARNKWALLASIPKPRAVVRNCICKCERCVIVNPNGLSFKQADYVRHLRTENAILGFNQHHDMDKDRNEDCDAMQLEEVAHLTRTAVDQETQHGNSGNSDTSEIHVAGEEQLEEISGGPDLLISMEEQLHDFSDPEIFVAPEDELDREENGEENDDAPKVYKVEDIADAALEDKILLAILELENVFEMHSVSESLKNAILRILFADNKECSLAALLSRKGNWDGLINGLKVPSSSKTMKRFLIQLGLTPIQRYAICYHREGFEGEKKHVFGAAEDDESVVTCTNLQCCPTCNKTRKDGVQFAVIPLTNRIRQMCSVPSLCWNLLHSWRLRADWLGKPIDSAPQFMRHFCHGRIWRQRQDLWNPKARIELPAMCPKCDTGHRCWPEVHPAVMDKKEYQSGFYIRCVNCSQQFKYEPRYIAGDPRHWAALLHRDGFQAATTKVHSVEAYTLVVLNGDPTLPESESFLLPLMYIPSEQVPEAGPNVFDVFEDVIMKMIDRLFCYGTEVDYAIDIPDFEDVKFSRHFIHRTSFFGFMGDHIAHCAISKTSQGGLNPCRYCHVRTGDGVFTELHKKSRFPDQPKTMQFILESIDKYERSKSTFKDHGVKGRSTLMRLHHSQGHDLTAHHPIDTMHTVALGVAKDTNENTFRLLEIKDGDTSKRKEVERRVIEVKRNRTPYLRNRRFPDEPFSRRGYWKADEHQTFAQLYAEYVFCGLISEDRMQLHQLQADCCRLIYDYTRTNGWSQEALDCLGNLQAAWRVMSEAFLGSNSKIIHHLFGSKHMIQDIRNYGGLDGTWCYRMERRFSKVNKVFTNHLHMELTFAKFANKIFFSEILFARIRDRNGLLHPQRWENLLHSSLTGDLKTGHIATRNQEEARFLGSQGVPEKWQEIIRETPILCGRSQTRNVSPMELSAAKQYDLQLSSDQVLVFKNCFFRGSLFRIGDHVAVTADTKVHDWYAQLVNIIVFSTSTGSAVYFTGLYYKICFLQDNSIERDSTGKVVLQGTLAMTSRCIRPLKHLLREICILDGDRGSRKVVLETRTVEVPSRLLSLGGVGIPRHYPCEGDVVRLQHSQNEVWMGVIDTVDYETQFFTMTWLRRLNRGWVRHYKERIEQPFGSILYGVPCQKKVWKGKGTVYVPEVELN